MFLDESDRILEVAGSELYPSEVVMLVGRQRDEIVRPLGARSIHGGNTAAGRIAIVMAEVLVTQSITLTGLLIEAGAPGTRSLVFAPLANVQPEQTGPRGRSTPGEASVSALSFGQMNFLALMSHELRTPLNVVTGFAELIQAEPHGSIGHPKYLEYVQDIWEAGAYLTRTVSDLLVLGHAGMSKDDLRLEVTDLRDCVHSAVRLNRYVADQRSIGIVTHLDPVPTVSCDEPKIVQALNNMIGNAVKYSHDNGAVEVHLRNKNGSGLAISVSDKGIGICEREVERVFDPFMRATNAKKMNIQGSGLGLAVVKSITEAHGGAVVISSEENEGTTVTLELPDSVIVDQPTETLPWETSE